MNESLKLSERQIREMNFYNSYSQLYNLKQPVNFSPVDGKEKRPWNSYWSVYELATKLYKPGAKLLDFGTGLGENALRLNRIGYQIEGFDISESSVNIAKELFLHYGREAQANFQIHSAESLPYQDEQFDFIAGIDILHHVEISEAITECKRVLKPNGTVVFREPIEAPFLDWLRNTLLFRYFAPKTTSYELHITDDERKLNAEDLKVIRSIFPKAKCIRSFVFARLDKFIRKKNDPSPSYLEKLDYYLLLLFPLLSFLGGAVVIVLTKEENDY